MAPSRKDKTKARKLASEKKLSDVASKESEKEPKKSTKTPSNEKSAREKRKKSSSSSAQKKRKHLSTLHPVKARLLDGEEDSSFTNKDTSKTEDEVQETGKKTPARDSDSAYMRKHGDNDTASFSSPPNLEEVGPLPAELRVALADTGKCLQQAEKQVRAISRTRIADSFPRRTSVIVDQGNPLETG
jgi:hypothetical protein